MSFQKKKNNEEAELEEIRKGFEMFDVDGTGKIIPSEVKEAMDSMNMKEKNPFIYEVIESLCLEKDYRNNGGVSIEDLVNYVYDKVNDNETNFGLRQLFDALKDPESETISMHTFIKLAKDYGDDEGMSEDELKYLLEKTQLGADELTFDEFYTIMKGGGSTSSKSNVSMRSSEGFHKKTPLSNITSQDFNISKKEENVNENNNINSNEEELNNDNTKSPEKSISIIKNTSNINIELDSFEKGINQIKMETQEEPEPQPEKKNESIKIDKKEDSVKIDKKEDNVIIDKKEDNVIIDKKEENVIIEKKEEKPYRKYKYNRFRKFDNNNNNSNSNNINENKDNKDNKVVVEEKTTVTKNVYRTRRPVNLYNNEDKKDEKKSENIEDKKDVEIPRKYHRRYRENKKSTNINH